MQQGPVQRFLFRLRPCVNLFYCLLLAHTLLVLKMTKRDTGVIGKLMIRRSKIDVNRDSNQCVFGIYALTTAALLSRQINARTWIFRAN